MKLFLFIFLLIILCSSVVNAKENATWIRSIFFRGFDPITKKRLVVKDIEDLATRLKKISPIIDQISFMFYETSIHDQQLYRENLLEQLQQIQEIKAEHKENFSQYLLGIGTFDSKKKLKNYRDLRFENNFTTLTVLKELEEKINSQKSIIDGLAIYSEWETTDSEWEVLHSFLKN